MKILVPLACAAALTVSTVSQASDLTFGSPAPALDVKTWLKGTPVTAFDPNQVYVVEFWATWCGPCKQSIPHLSELAKKYPKVKFIGVSIWEDDKEGSIKKFVDMMGDKMDYTVGYSGNQTGMAKSWMAASGQNGIPTAFVVEHGNIDWIGHPMTLDQPLGEVTTGKYDLAAHKAAFQKEQAAQLEQQKAYQSLTDDAALYKSGKKAEAKADLEKIVAKYPMLEAEAESIRFGWLALEDKAAWRKQVESDVASNDQAKLMKVLTYGLNQRRPGGDQASGAEAFELAIKGTKSQNLLALYYAAVFYRESKDNAKALKYVSSAIELWPNSQFKGNAQLGDALKAMKAEIQSASTNSK